MTKAATAAIETRFDSLIQRISMLEAAVPFSSRPAVREVLDELKRLRRDLSSLEAGERLGPPPQAVTGSGTRERHQRIGHYQREVRPGQRFCNRHGEDAKGAWLPVEKFDIKNKVTGARRSWCRDCFKAYQRERYVAVATKTMTVELLEGDRCIGRDCPACGLPFEIGDRIRGEALHHERCA